MFNRVYLLLPFLMVILAQKINLDALNNYSEFLNFGDKKLHKVNKERTQNELFKSKIDVLGEVFKTNIDLIKTSPRLDIVFLIDASSSVGEHNFKSEIKFVKKLLSDITVDFNHTRVAIVTFSSEDNIVKNVDEISQSSTDHNKCELLNSELTGIKYRGGDTFTLGAFEIAKDIFATSNRNDSKKVLFLITDGYSNGGDPTHLAKELKNNKIVIFTIGIQNGNYKELYELSSSPGEFYSFLLDSFEEFESLARRALHVDLKSGDYVPLGFNRPCDILCEEGDCCDKNAICTCGTTTGHYSCVCAPGYYGTGLKNSCFPCVPGTYSDGPNLCLPCPHPLHVTTPPANGIESCKCRQGYRPTKNFSCKEIKCPKLPIPKNGYIVQKGECPTVINAACGIRCEVGYNLKGTSVRECLSNGTWSGIEPICEIRTCTSIEVPEHGAMKCHHPDLGIEYDVKEKKLPVDAVCSFECDTGRIMIGSQQRTCIPLARWDGIRTSCKPITCNRLPQIKFGKIEPPSCLYGKQEFGKECHIACKDGFKIGGPAQRKCIGLRTWDSNVQDTTCNDMTPPNLMCPDKVLGKTLQGKKFGHVEWEPPIVTDNSGLNVSVWTKPAVENITNFKFSIGVTSVTYFAQDAFRNKARCSFNIIIKDEELPIIENCIDPPTFLTSERNGANITWDEPHIYDNSGDIEIKKSHEFGYFAVGTTTVTYTVTDQSGNVNVCKMNITIEVAECESLPDPVNGLSECNNVDEGLQCIITCQEGYAIPIEQKNSEGNGTSFECKNADPVWYNHNQDDLHPECSVTKIPKEVLQNGVVTLDGPDICDNVESKKEIENDVKVLIASQMCIGNCTVDIKSECEIEKEEEATNKIISKRDVRFETVPHKNRSKKYRKKVNLKYQVRAKHINEINNMTEDFRLSGSYNVTIRRNKTLVICPNGFIPRKSRCVQCPKGTFHNTTRNRCQSCPFGYYNVKLGQTECISCPQHFSTRKMHSKKYEDCKGQCPPGTYARRKLLKYSKHKPNMTLEIITLQPYCRSCRIGRYQSDFGQIKCLSCPNGYTTTGPKSTHSKQCIPNAEELCKRNICLNGDCIGNNDYEYTCNCLPNFIGTNCEILVNYCDSQPCYNGGTCLYSKDGYTCSCDKGFTGKLCQEYVDECNKNCLNNGTCIQADNETSCLCPRGYSGDSCESKTDNCRENLCENNSTCSQGNETFHCKCTNGYVGRRCNLLPCDFKPCSSNQDCINNNVENATKESFTCICREGYTGINCNETTDHCVSSPCQNGGICNNDIMNYTCVCSSLYFGFNCENKRATKYLLEFPNYSTNNFVQLQSFSQNITQVTACLWMQTLDNFNYGTLISYATNHSDNAFTLTDYTGLVLYINTNYIVTDTFLNDGFWHHMCVTWKSLNGSYEVYVDGTLRNSGFNLSADTHIEGYGNMIIGQEQDILGGKFSQSESFVGKMSYVDIWSRALSQEEIWSHFNDCNDSFFGDLYSWPEIQEHVRGGIEVKNSTFCKKCEDPNPLFNGFIDTVENVAYYSCYKGHMLNDNRFAKGRKCNKASKWEGDEEPYCKKVYCGYPGFIRNGYITGDQYNYQDIIIYNCYEGFNMTGNSRMVCQENGTWYPEKPHCIGVQCTAFGQPKHSTVTILSDQSYEAYIEHETKFDVGTQIEIICAKNANMTGENILTCSENGLWDNEPPECTVNEKDVNEHLGCTISKVPDPPNNGYIDVESLYSAGNATTNFVEYKCRPGYKLHGDNISTCIIDGYWTEPNISCIAIICSKPSLPQNMILNHKEMMNKEIYSFGNMIKFKCNEGYNMFGNNIIRCTQVGKWSRMQGKCVRKACKKPPVKEETVIQGNRIYMGTKSKLAVLTD